MSQTLEEMARRLRHRYPDARYELDWKTPEQLLVATILAGGSKDSAVNAITGPLFARWPSPQALAEADAAELEAILTPLGLGKQKSNRIQATCRELVARFGGKIPRSLEQLIELPGVGRKTANVVLTQGLGIASGIIVDVHVTRVAQRMGLSSNEEADQIEHDLLPQLPQEQWVHFGAAAILHGRNVCTARAPKCPECDLKDLCPRIGVTAVAAAPAPTVASPPTAASAWPDEYQLPASEIEPAPPIAAASTSFATAATTATATAATSTSAAAAAAPSVKAAMLPDDWRDALAEELASPWYQKLEQTIAFERANHTVFPPPAEVFTAFHLTPFADARVVLLGQDPYHGPGQGHGLAFSVKEGVKPPPSLVNIYKELAQDVGCTIPTTGCLTQWAKQGVLMLNAVLTVRQGEANSHQALGWERLTDAVIRRVGARNEHVVFVLWGAYARKKAALINRDRHTVVEGAHPSPLSAKLWFGSRPFSKINQALEQNGQPKINWQIG